MGMVHNAACPLLQVEEREIQRLVVAAVDTQLKRIELKLKSVEELEQVGWNTWGVEHRAEAWRTVAAHAADF
jgi:hypothetical protein